MDDTEFLRAFLAGWPAGEHVGHREHLRIAWLVIARHGPEVAIPGEDSINRRSRRKLGLLPGIPRMGSVDTRNPAPRTIPVNLRASPPADLGRKGLADLGPGPDPGGFALLVDFGARFSPRLLSPHSPLPSGRRRVEVAARRHAGVRAEGGNERARRAVADPAGDEHDRSSLRELQEGGL